VRGATRVQVGEISTQIRGVSYSKAEAQAVPGPGYVPILRATNIGDDSLDFDDLVFVPEADVNPRQMLRENDVLVAASSGSLASVGKAASMQGNFTGAFGAFCKVLRPGDEVHPRYFAHFFRTSRYRRRIASLAAGANINNIRNEHLDDLEIPLPPLDEQRWIAQVLDAADALRAKRRECIDRVHDLTRAAFDSLLARGVSKSWFSGPLSLAVSQIRIGPFGSALHSEDYVAGGAPVVNPLHIRPDGIHPDPNCSVTEAKKDELGVHVLDPGDVVLGRRGEMGRCAVVGPEQIGMICGTGTMVLRPNRDVASPTFLQALLSSSSIRARLAAQSLGVTMANLNKTTVGDLRVAIPPLRVQEQFEETVGAATGLRSSAQAHLHHLDALFASLQHRAFAGEL